METCWALDSVFKENDDFKFKMIFYWKQKPKLTNKDFFFQAWWVKSEPSIRFPLLSRTEKTHKSVLFYKTEITHFISFYISPNNKLKQL